MNLAAYFERIAYTGSTAPTLETLAQIQYAHLMTVPFENLNIHMPRPIILDESRLFEKIVHEQRGGYCFEQNGLFAAVLRELGFAVQRIECVIFNHELQRFSVTMCHMGLLVTVDESRYLVDVASNFLAPLDIDSRAMQVQQSGLFQIRQDGEQYSLYRQLAGAKTPELAYIFFLRPHDLEDYEAANMYMQESRHSNFTQKRICSQFKADGRYTLSDRSFIFTAWDGTRHESPVNSEAEFHALLEQHFGIVVQTQAPQAVLEIQKAI